MARKLVSVSTEPTKNFNELLSYANDLSGVVDMLHCDVMDKSFVGRELLSLETVEKLNNHSLIMLDVHLMTADLHDDYEKWIKAGANILTVHYESFESEERLFKVIKSIREKGALCGVSFKPKTDINKILKVLNFVDLVLVMSVEPGKSAQKFLEESYEKIRLLNDIREKNNLKFLIEVDGGISPENSQKIYACGADILVSGSYVYSSEDRQKAIYSLKGESQI